MDLIGKNQSEQLNINIQILKKRLLILHGGGLSCSIVAQEGGDLILVEAQREVIHCQLVAVSVHLHQILNVDTRFQISWYLLDAHRFGEPRSFRSIQFFI